MASVRDAEHTAYILPHAADHPLDHLPRVRHNRPRAPGLLHTVSRSHPPRPDNGAGSRLHGSFPLRLRRHGEHPHEQGAAVLARRRQLRDLCLAHEQGEHGAAIRDRSRQGVRHPECGRHRDVPAGSCCAVEGQDRCRRREQAGLSERCRLARRSHTRSLQALSERGFHNRRGRPEASPPRGDEREALAAGARGDAGIGPARDGEIGARPRAHLPQQLPHGSLLHRDPGGGELRLAHRQHPRRRRPRGMYPAVLPPDMIVLSTPAPAEMVTAVGRAIELLPTIDPYKMHERMTRMYSWIDVAERTEVVYNLAAATTRRSLRDRLPRYLRCGPWAGKLFSLVVIIDYIIWLLLEWWQPRQGIDAVP